MDDAIFLKLLNEQKDDMKEFIQVTHSLNRAKLINEFDPIKDTLYELVKAEQQRNGRIEKNEDDIECLKKETYVSRWMHRNPAKTVISIVILIAMIALGAYQINVKKTIEQHGVILKQSDTVIRESR